jgi:putative flavoprotein involved in K+ transport
MLDVAPPAKGVLMTAAESSTDPATTRVKWYDTIIVGGGQAGLAVGYHLAKRDVDFVILEAGPRIGESWRTRWDSLRLFTPARYSGLPGMPFPDAPGHLPDKDQVGDYLERYAERFDLPVLLETAVERLEHDGTGFLLHTNRGVFTADNVVVATGPLRRPRIPEISSRLGPHIHQLHSRDYRSPFDLPDGPVLVVGAGNSGAQISLELSRSRSVSLAGPALRRLPRKVLGLDVFHWIWPLFHHLTLDTWLGRLLRRRVVATDPLIGVTARDFASHGVRRLGRVDGVRDGLPSVADVAVDVRTVLWATGFTQDFGWLDVPVLEPDGTPRHRRGVSELAGLYFVGLRFQHRQSSALIGGVGQDAEYVAGRIVRRG